jgi:hypothetical protein
VRLLIACRVYADIPSILDSLPLLNSDNHNVFLFLIKDILVIHAKHLHIRMPALNGGFELRYRKYQFGLPESKADAKVVLEKKSPQMER